MTVKFYHWKHPNLLLWRTRGGNQWPTFPQSSKRIRLMAVSPGSQPQGTGLGCLHHGIYSHQWWTNEQWVKITTLNPTQHWSHWKPWESQVQSWGPRRLTCLNCLGIWSLKGCHTSTHLAIWQSRGLRRVTHFDLSRDPVLGRPTWLNLTGDSISQTLSCLNLPGDLHTDLGIPSSQVATVLGRVSFRKTHP